MKAARLWENSISDFACPSIFTLVSVAGMLSDYPWKDLPKDVQIVDVGGGNGAFLLPLLQAHPHLRGVLQDKSNTVPQAEAFFKAQYPQAITDGRVVFENYDFFTPQTRKGKDVVYLLRWVLHDWNDTNSIKILKVLAESMDQDSRIIVIDTVIDTAVAGAQDSKAGESGKVNYP